MGAEIGCLEADPLDIGIKDLGDTLIGEPLGSEPAALCEPRPKVSGI
jgi:hypothetical protein